MAILFLLGGEVSATGISSAQAWAKRILHEADIQGDVDREGYTDHMEYCIWNADEEGESSSL